jgi:hypothetical protein
MIKKNHKTNRAKLLYSYLHISMEVVHSVVVNVVEMHEVLSHLIHLFLPVDEELYKRKYQSSIHFRLKYKGNYFKTNRY